MLQPGTWTVSGSHVTSGLPLVTHGFLGGSGDLQPACRHHCCLWPGTPVLFSSSPCGLGFCTNSMVHSGDEDGWWVVVAFPPPYGSVTMLLARLSSAPRKGSLRAQERHGRREPPGERAAWVLEWNTRRPSSCRTLPHTFPLCMCINTHHPAPDAPGQLSTSVPRLACLPGELGPSEGHALYYRSSRVGSVLCRPLAYKPVL